MSTAALTYGALPLSPVAARRRASVTPPPLAEFIGRQPAQPPPSVERPGFPSRSDVAQVSAWLSASIAAEPGHAPPLFPTSSAARAPLDPDRVTDRVAVVRAECPTPVVLASQHVDTATGEILATGDAIQMPCGTWGCTACGPHKRRSLVAHFADTLGALPSLALVTLTLDPSTGVVPEESRRFIVHLWSLWRKRMNRRRARAGLVGPLPFVAAVEHQERTGLAHLHVVCSLDGIDADEAAEAWCAIGGGIVADVQPITAARFVGDDADGPRGSAARALGYVLKYALKEASERPAGSRRHLLTSQGIGYDSAAAKQRRREHYAAETGTAVPDPTAPRPSPIPGAVEVLVPNVTGRRAPSPDTLTAQDRARFAVLRSRPGRTSYRYLDRAGRWWRITQQPGEARTRRRIPPPPRWAARAGSA